MKLELQLSQALSAQQLLEMQEKTQYTEIVRAVVDAVRGFIHTELDRASIDPNDDFNVMRFAEPYVTETLERVGPELLEIGNTPEITLLEYRHLVAQLLHNIVPSVISDIDPEKGHTRQRIDPSIDKLVSEYHRLNPVPQHQAVMDVEGGQLDDISLDDLPLLAGIYHSRRLGPHHALQLVRREYDELNAFMERGGFLGTFEDYEGPRLRHLLDTTKFSATKGKSRMVKFAKETMVGKVLRVRGEIRAWGWYSLPPIIPEGDDEYMRRIEKKVEEWPNKEEMARLMRAGLVGELEMIQSNIIYGAPFVLNAMHTEVGKRLQKMNLKRDFRSFTSYYISDIVGRVNGADIQSEVIIQNMGSNRLLANCGYSTGAEIRADKTARPWATHETTDENGKKIIIDLWAHRMPVSGRRHDIREKTRNYMQQLKAMLPYRRRR